MHLNSCTPPFAQDSPGSGIFTGSGGERHPGWVLGGMGRDMGGKRASHRDKSISKLEKTPSPMPFSVKSRKKPHLQGLCLLQV